MDYFGYIVAQTWGLSYGTRSRMTDAEIRAHVMSLYPTRWNPETGESDEYGYTREYRERVIRTAINWRGPEPTR